MKFKMRHAKMSLLVVLTLLPYSSSYSVSYKNEMCDPHQKAWRDWEFYCPNKTNRAFELELYRPDDADLKFASLKCRDANSWWSDFGVEPGEAWYKVDILVIQWCPLPELTFSEIVEKLGLSNVSNVTFSSYMNLSSSMMHRHLLNLETIEYLHLPRNGFTELPSDLLRDVTKIAKVDLSSNCITTLPFDLFDGLQYLWKIDLRFNRMEMIDWRMFRNCPRLLNLYLAGNLLTTLDDRIFRDRFFGYLDIARNELETLPNRIFELTDVRILDISANKFALLPDKLFDDVSMIYLRFTDNSGNLTTLPDHWLSHLTQLERVVLARNALTILPETIFWGTVRLRDLDLSGNALTSIPPDIFRYSKRLDSLDISENLLNSLPENLFRGLSKLRELNLERNNLTSISQNLFSGLLSLAHLNLGFNSIVTIDQAAFEDLLSLRIIRLSHNSIISSEIFYIGLRPIVEFWNIQKIYLDHNDLVGWIDFSKILYTTSTTLRLVDLSSNRIQGFVFREKTSVPANVEYVLKHTKHNKTIIPEDWESRIDIRVYNNPLSCECPLYDLLGYLQGNTQTKSLDNIRVVPGDAVCGEPCWMTNVYVADVRPETFMCRPVDDERYAYCAERCNCWWIPHNETRLVNCTFRNLTKVPERLIGFLGDKDEKQDPVLGRYINGGSQWLHWQKSPVKLDLADNSLVELPPLNTFGYEYVETLILSRNNISKLSSDILPPQLKVVYLDHNNLKRFNPVAWNALINLADLTKLNFEGNPWSCDSITRRALDLMGNKLGPDLRYATKKCLDYRNPPNIGEKSTQYISYTVF